MTRRVTRRLEDGEVANSVTVHKDSVHRVRGTTEATGQPRKPPFLLGQETRKISGLHGVAISTTTPERKTQCLADLMTGALVIKVRMRQGVGSDPLALERR